MKSYHGLRYYALFRSKKGPLRYIPLRDTVWIVCLISLQLHLKVDGLGNVSISPHPAGHGSAFPLHFDKATASQAVSLH